ncbi:sulfur transferase domain-containing protein [Stenotrophomonas sp. S41]|uniref:fused DSP-PTPase phosphatase/NAD kinase-like protein n=1 Tax=Stenotrophomonas sp. S41 TaxID=2767464 RepID=UPI00190CA105|nr:sulfur transferase domain-containing protein [Stenotrophomonas sp. S41]MBK0012941.1 tyrosine-protein phosphatase [Stenotrophomonas sp. S41]
MLLRLTCLLLLSLCTTLPAWAGDTPLNEVRPGLYAGGQPSAAQLQALAAQGMRTVIDLRQPGEDRGFDETAQAEALGLRYVRIPVAGAEGLDAANVRAVHQALQQSQGPVLLHCASGNRAGAVLGLVNARYEHASPEQALQLGQRAGLSSLEAATRQRLAAPTSHP